MLGDILDFPATTAICQSNQSTPCRENRVADIFVMAAAVFLHVYLAQHSQAPSRDTDKRIYYYGDYVRLHCYRAVVQESSYVLARDSSDRYNIGRFLFDTVAILLPLDGGDGRRGFFDNGNICAISMEMVRQNQP
jgi:hypothetical protein